MYKIGEMVVVLPTEETLAFVGEIEGIQKTAVFDTETGTTKELIYLVNHLYYTEGELVSTGEKLVIDGADVTLTNIGFVDGECQLTFDNEFTILVEQLYCDEDGLHIYNGEHEAEEKSYDDDWSLAFMFGYLEAVEDANDYINKDDCLWDKALASIDGVANILHLISNHRDKLIEFFNTVMELKNLADTDTEQTDMKPELTLDEIKEKLGYDFNLVD